MLSITRRPASILHVAIPTLDVLYSIVCICGLKDSLPYPSLGFMGLRVQGSQRYFRPWPKSARRLASYSPASFSRRPIQREITHIASSRLFPTKLWARYQLSSHFFTQHWNMIRLYAKSPSRFRCSSLLLNL